MYYYCYTTTLVPRHAWQQPIQLQYEAMQGVLSALPKSAYSLRSPHSSKRQISGCICTSWPSTSNVVALVIMTSASEVSHWLTRSQVQIMHKGHGMQCSQKTFIFCCTTDANKNVSKKIDRRVYMCAATYFLRVSMLMSTLSMTVRYSIFRSVLGHTITSLFMSSQNNHVPLQV